MHKRDSQVLELGVDRFPCRWGSHSGCHGTSHTDCLSNRQDDRPRVPGAPVVISTRKIMLAINMRLFKTVFVLVILSSLIMGHPLDLEVSKEDTRSSKPDVPEDHYDQRQNGTDNYRIHVDGVVLVVAPIEGLLLAGGLGGAGNTPNFSAFGQNDLLIQPKPETVNLEMPKPDLEDIKPIDAKSAHRSSLRLVNLIAPLLRRIHQ